MKAYTDINQSKKLAKILPLESADMYDDEHDWYDVPAWSLAALLEVLPNYQLQTQDDGIEILCSCNGKFNIITADNSVDACVAMIVKLKKERLL